MAPDTATATAAGIGAHDLELLAGACMENARTGKSSNCPAAARMAALSMATSEVRWSTGPPPP
eukprot:CAMPEP_0175765518 /NCGR_PEP_ID=MMETSP0097-20121207/68847_1 /TAXON_ID=311494 /ORGANISM="Alexandrium monilatum, Strain CCMP3105" /LENGTH=62 /DNA_ID=CAMNT_0017075387 /DNA_START=34 /DNA_END=218 /DNA_ORIENTATION=-